MKTPFATTVARSSLSTPVFLFGLLSVVLLDSQRVSAVTAEPEDLAEARQWATATFTAIQQTNLPFSFNFDGRPSAGLLRSWGHKRSSRQPDDKRTEHTLVWTDPQTGLQVRCVALEYHDFPTVEWTIYFKNTGTNATPTLADIRSLDLQLQRHSSNEFVLHHHTGDNCTADSYQPHQTVLGTNSTQRFAPAGGRPTTGAFPYFNVEHDGGGAIAVIGWPGQWAAQFVRDHGTSLRLQGGQELTHFKLLPGEEVRSPLSVLMFWKGDWVRSQNLWRRWMIAHNLPRPGGKVVPTHYAGCFGKMQPHADEEITQIDGWLKEGIKLDYWFIDAGWYPGRGQWSNVGTWEVDTTRFPRGLREVADHCHAKGIKFIVWFEPERVTAGSWLAEQHPEWVLGGKKGGLLNLGNPEAWRWVLERIDNLLTSQGIDVYRQDFNIEPLPRWRANDTPDRQGITEIKHITGYLAFWDELLRRHPGMYIDTCASGGRRNDLETLRRAVPLLRSDYPVSDFTPRCANGQQGQTYGISLWIPYHGTGAPLSDAYTMRSSFVPAYRLGWDTRNQNIDHALLRKTVADFRAVEMCLLGDFYPLTPYSVGDDVWIAWQFDAPESGKGMVQVFRRANSTNEVARLRLGGLEPGARYRLADLDASAPTEIAGRELKENGLQVRLPKKCSSAIVAYQRLK
jgi:alpha-galactosidase